MESKSYNTSKEFINDIISKVSDATEDYLKKFEDYDQSLNKDLQELTDLNDIMTDRLKDILAHKQGLTAANEMYANILTNKKMQIDLKKNRMSNSENKVKFLTNTANNSYKIDQLVNKESTSESVDIVAILNSLASIEQQ